jgi:pimeloyl-ACP methyl ester carboxylesterase
MASITTPDGTDIVFDDHEGGNGTPLVLVHGITENAATWDPLITRLTSKRRVIALDLRGHGRSGHADQYDLGAMASDVVAVATALELTSPHLVGHSLGGIVVSAAGTAFPVSSVVNVDQSLRLDGFKDQLSAFEVQLRDPDAFPLVMEGLFQMMAGDRLSDEQAERVSALRRPDQDVVLGVWDVILSSTTDEIAATVSGALAAYTDLSVPYLSIFGIDPGDGYDTWISSNIPGATTEVWADHGHYPHLVDTDRFVSRLDEFWS